MSPSAGAVVLHQTPLVDKSWIQITFSYELHFSLFLPPDGISFIKSQVFSGNSGFQLTASFLFLIWLNQKSFI